MLIVVSDTGFRSDEAILINALFDEGLQLFHVRKPEASASAIQFLLEGINPVHLSKIALHQQHSLAEIVAIKRLHFPEAIRKKTAAEEWLQLKKRGYTLSTSIHRIEEEIADVFDYAFFGPVFNSISKKGYTAMAGSTFNLQPSKLVAIGGIDENNCTSALAMGFAGVAVLGAIWQNDEPVKQFKKIQRQCSSIVP